MTTPYQKSKIDRYYQHLDTMTTQKLSELVSDLWLAEGQDRAKMWEVVAKALPKTQADPARVARIMAGKDLQELAKLVGELSLARPVVAKSGTGTPATSAPATATPPASTVAAEEGKLDPKAVGPDGKPAPEVLKVALKAFRKRLKLTRLDEESKLGRSPLSAGKRSQVVAIVPPNQFPLTVWEELAAQGKLKTAGRGFYELVGE